LAKMIFRGDTRIFSSCGRQACFPRLAALLFKDKDK